jgi:hypothetical protein
MNDGVVMSRTGLRKFGGNLKAMVETWWPGVWGHRQPKSEAFGEFNSRTFLSPFRTGPKKFGGNLKAMVETWWPGVWGHRRTFLSPFRTGPHIIMESS